MEQVLKQAILFVTESLAGLIGLACEIGVKKFLAK